MSNKEGGGALAWDEEIYQALKANDIRLICYVPDIVLADLIKMLEADDQFTVIPVTREEEGIGVLSGGFLGGMKGAMLLQNSGLGNCINALGSLSIPHQIPFLLLVSVRGDVGEHNGLQLTMGRVVEPILDLLNIRHITPRTEEEAGPAVDRMCRTIYRGFLPGAVMLARELTGGKVE